MGKEIMLINGAKDDVPRAIRATYGKTKTSAALLDNGFRPTFIMENLGKWRIRKLTPRECFRLMDVDDADIGKIQAAGIPKTQQYKLAGNSIVVACMERIFHQLLIDQTDKSRQPSLF